MDGAGASGPYPAVAGNRSLEGYAAMMMEMMKSRVEEKVFNGKNLYGVKVSAAGLQGAQPVSTQLSVDKAHMRGGEDEI